MIEKLQEQNLVLLRDQLIQLRAEGKLGVIAARSSVPEWVIRDWCDNSLHVPCRVEVARLQEVLDNRKRHTPNVHAVNGTMPPDVDCFEREVD